ncbi:uncharacterized protein LOC129751587 [Uranotaenia lowii]|uniref:uncharacterized protein LOC129751587 n=1 Tax=Uranotaenia lowii TaxID=190385 RepID=UPI00247992E5|nr:uncharacterized protein LOC129751587 [Uranotaenia lowii]
MGLNRLSVAVATVVLSIALMIVQHVEGHGMVLDPIARGSRWRCRDGPFPNYNDMEQFCGGFQAQWEDNEGRCGLCGDNYADVSPRLHELGGLYGDGEIVRSYQEGSIIDVTVQITANHRGYFLFDLCNLSEEGSETEECFEKNQLLDANGRREWYLNSTANVDYHVKLQLPDNFTCEHCILQWTYITANSWGICEDGSGKLGCGAQENFRTCSDITISSNATSQPLQYCTRKPQGFEWAKSGLNAVEVPPPEDFD